jgi:hypothetical protein
MNHTLFKALIASVPASVLFAGTVVLFWKVRNLFSLLQLVGAGSLVMVVLVHVFEALHLFPWMGWGLEHSVGHYLDISCALVGFTLFPLGYLFQGIRMRRSTAL